MSLKNSMLEMHFHEMSEHSLACNVISKEILVTHSHHTLAVIGNSIAMSGGFPRKRQECQLTKQGNSEYKLDISRQAFFVLNWSNKIPYSVVTE